MAKHVEDRLESKRAEDAVAIAEDDEEDERNNRYVVLCMRFVCVCVCVCVCVDSFDIVGVAKYPSCNPRRLTKMMQKK